MQASCQGMPTEHENIIIFTGILFFQRYKAYSCDAGHIAQIPVVAKQKNIRGRHF